MRECLAQQPMPVHSWCECLAQLTGEEEKLQSRSNATSHDCTVMQACARISGGSPMHNHLQELAMFTHTHTPV